MLSSGSRPEHKAVSAQGCMTPQRVAAAGGVELYLRSSAQVLPLPEFLISSESGCEEAVRPQAHRPQLLREAQASGSEFVKETDIERGEDNED